MGDENTAKEAKNRLQILARYMQKKLGYTVIVGPMKMDTDRLPSELELRENSRNAKEQAAILRAYGLDKS